MKQEILIGTWCLRVVLMVLLNGIVPQMVSASLNESTHRYVRWDEDTKCWVYAERSLPLIPTACIDTNALSIENLIAGKDITINILNNDMQSVYEETISKLSSSSIVIMLHTFSEGDYTLELRNSFGGYLSGDFTIY